MCDAATALARLREGNQRFISRDRESTTFRERKGYQDLTDGQEPFAIILGCSDSRAPAELVFDQGLGDLFVIRVAGNIIAPSIVDSVEFAAVKLNTRLAVVMGHTGCGAVKAALDDIDPHTDEEGRRLDAIVDRIRPAIEELTTVPELHADPDRLYRHAVRANVRVAVDHLRTGSRVLEDLILHQGLRVVGAEYSLESGLVDFFDEV